MAEVVVQVIQPLLIRIRIFVLKLKSLFAAALLGTLAAPIAAQAQGVPGGMAHGFHEGNRRAGPVGAIVGAGVGGIIGGVEGVLGVNHAAYGAPVYYGTPGYYGGGTVTVHPVAPQRAYRHRHSRKAHRKRYRQSRY